jgi:hypothetical protein
MKLRRITQRAQKSQIALALCFRMIGFEEVWGAG